MRSAECRVWNNRGDSDFSAHRNSTESGGLSLLKILQLIFEESGALMRRRYARVVACWLKSLACRIQTRSSLFIKIRYKIFLIGSKGRLWAKGVNEKSFSLYLCSIFFRAIS